MRSVYDGQIDELAVVHRTRAILDRKGYRLEKLTGVQAEAKAKCGFGPYSIIGGTGRGKVIAEGLGIEQIETKADDIGRWLDEQVPRTQKERGQQRWEAAMRGRFASSAAAPPKTITSDPVIHLTDTAPSPAPEPVIHLTDRDPRDARITELEAENRSLREMVRFLDQYRPR